MSTITRSFARYIALPAVSAGILGGAALGLAGMANAGTYSYEPTPRPGIVATPGTIARPPVVVIPGRRWHHDRGLIINLPSGE
jgi:hypothetical protein